MIFLRCSFAWSDTNFICLREIHPTYFFSTFNLKNNNRYVAKYRQYGKYALNIQKNCIVSYCKSCLVGVRTYLMNTLMSVRMHIDLLNIPPTYFTLPYKHKFKCCFHIIKAINSLHCYSKQQRFEWSLNRFSCRLPGLLVFNTTPYLTLAFKWQLWHDYLLFWNRV